MKVFVVLLSVTAVALASLEPAGYRPPGSSASSQYQHHHHEHDHEELVNPLSPISQQYLPPTYSRQAAPVNSNQYVPPRSRQQQQPATNYLPPIEKPIPSLAPPSPPADNYLPPIQTNSQQLPSDQYLPPQINKSQPTSAPVNDYLPPSRTTPAVPANEYLPPPKPSTTTVTVKSEYLPPVKAAPSAQPPQDDYLPPTSRLSNRPTAATQQRIATTPVPRISVVPSYSPNAPAYTKSQSKFSGLTNSATSSPPKNAYPQRGYSSPIQTLKAPQQPADNYLPPLNRESSQTYESSAQDGYQYGIASYTEETTEPAKYDFEYRVSDEFGNDFGHKESRDGAQTSGVYTVLLPDGRKQIVTYEADENGFKPRISYEEAASVLGPKAATLADDAFGGYDSNANSIDAHQGPY